MGFALGVWTTSFTLTSAFCFQSVGPATAMYLLSGILAMTSVYPLWLTCQGQFHRPPPLATSQADAGLAGGFSFADWRFWQLAIHLFIITSMGGGMKALLSPISETAYETSYIQSACLAAASISLFTVTRGLSPLLSGLIPLCPISAGLMALDAVLYWSNPWIIANLNVLWLTLSKTITGACFGSLQMLGAMIALEMFGPANFGKAWPLLSPFIAMVFVGKTSDGILHQPFRSDCGESGLRSLFLPLLRTRSVGGIECTSARVPNTPDTDT